MFEPNTEGDEMRIKLCSSFSFNSRTLLRRISPTDILATDFAHGHFVVVYIKDTPTKGAINIAVMSNNSNNDLVRTKKLILNYVGINFVATVHVVSFFMNS
jgi:hypothetical protein